jgi:hypothetical protein
MFDDSTTNADVRGRKALSLVMASVTVSSLDCGTPCVSGSQIISETEIFSTIDKTIEARELAKSQKISSTRSNQICRLVLTWEDEEEFGNDQAFRRL